MAEEWPGLDLAWRNIRNEPGFGESQGNRERKEIELEKEPQNP